VNLDRVAAVIRPRSPWEAIDLGFSMVRAWWRPLLSGWLATVAPVWCLVFLFLSGRPGLALFILWWLRPLFDRVPLHVVSRCLFGDVPSAGTVAADLRQLWGRDLLAALTVQRLDPARSFHLPVGQLEGLTGAARRRRKELLNRSGRAAATWLTAACALLELVMVLALVGLITLLSPWEASLQAALQTAWADETVPYWLGVAFGGLAFLAFLIIEPFYVAAGFSLYLSRRTQLEGWDVEIAFRRLAGRLTGARRGRGRAAAVALLVLGLGAAGISEAGVRGLAATTPDPTQVLHRVLASPDFRTRKKVTTWRLKDGKPAPEEKSPRFEPPSLRMPGELISVIAMFAGAVMVVILVALLIGVARNWRRRGPRGEADEDKDALPEAVFGLDIRPESLPPDVPAAAWAAWEQGDPAAALGLLYRGALACLVHRDGLEVAASWTEGDCLTVVRRRASPASADYFTALTRAWQSTAYAHRPPAGEETKVLCTGWRRHYSETTETAGMVGAREAA
jgi:hypothetical protein